MRAAALLAVFFIPATALAQDAAPEKRPPTVGGKPIAQVKPSAPAGCKFVGTVRGTKLWAGDCTAASELRPTSTGDETSSTPLTDQAVRAIPKGQQ
jgi:hypothetical protein